MQLNIVVNPFINVLRAYLNVYFANDSVHSFMSTYIVSASCPVTDSDDSIQTRTVILY